MRRSCNEDGATVKVSFSIRLASLSEGIDCNYRDNGENSMRVVLFWKDFRPNSIEYFEHHVGHLDTASKDAPQPNERRKCGPGKAIGLT